MARQANQPRRDRRYKDPDAAPPVVSEKRMTFFLAESAHRELRRQTGLFQIFNLESEPEDPLPESPSALVREAINFWLDHFRSRKEQRRTDEEWEERLDTLSRALDKR